MSVLSRPKSRQLSSLAALLLGLGASACTDAESFTGPIVRVEVQVVPIGTPTTNLARGITVQLRAVPVNADENFVDLPATWTTSSAAVATVDNTGLVTTVGGGNVTITATVDGQSGTFDLNVQFPVGTVTLGGAVNSTIRREGTAALTATVLGTDGQPATGRTVTWTSSNQAVATVSNAGVVSGVTDGTVTISATSEGVSGSTTITVSGAPLVSTVTLSPANPFRGVGQTVQLSHESKAGSGTVIPGTTAAWTTSAAGVATVDPVTGLVTIAGPGTATITATVNNGIGTNILGTTTVTGAPLLVKGAATAVPTVASAGVFLYAYDVPAGATSLTVTSSGGTGDADIYIFAPGVVPSALSTNPNTLAFSNSTAFSANSGNGESITRTNPPAGVWRIYVNAWPGDVAVTGLTLTVNHAP